MAAVHLLVPLINSVEREEEVELDGEVEEPGLSSTRTSRSRVGKEEVGKEEKSVFFDSDEGIWKCRHCTWTYLTENSAIDHERFLRSGVCWETQSLPGSYFLWKIKGTGSAEENDVENSKPITNGAINHANGHETEKKLEFDNGLHAGESHHTFTEIVNIETSVINKEVRFSSYESEIKSDEPIGESNELEEEVVEYDVEKVLEEQETHDLFCPKCQSCITKRVILRKRKRIGKPLQGESKRGKLPDEGIDVPDDDPVVPSIPDQPQRREGFGCLECWNFFISTASGLKILGIFRWNLGEVYSQPSSRQTAVQDSIGSSSVIAQNPDENSGSRNEGDPKHKKIDERVISVPPHLERDAGSGGKKESARQQNDQKVISVMPSPHREVDLGSQGYSETGGKIETAAKQHGANGFQFLPRKFDDQKLETYEQNTIKITNVGGLISDGLDSSKSSIVESEGIEQLKGVRQLLPESTQPTPLPAFPGTSTEGEHLLDIGPQIDERPTYEWDVVKSIVYGGLIELIASLGVVSSAAGSDSTTLNIVVLALANLFGGLTVLAHNLKELISGHKERDQTSQDEERYFKTLGLRTNYRLHIVVSIISYIIFGLLPPIIYGFSFRKSDEKNYKIIAVAGASLFCILLLAIGKAHVQQSPKPYIKTVIYYLATGLTSSGLSYAVGELLRRALEETGLFDSTTGGSTPSSSTSMIGTWSPKTGWEAY